MKRIAKFIAALVGAALVVLSSALSDGDFSLVEQIQVAVAVATAAGVYIAANLPALTGAKTAIAAVLAALNLVIVYLTDAAGTSLTGSEWVNVGLSVLTAVGVFTVSNGTAVAVRDDPEDAHL